MQLTLVAYLLPHLLLPWSDLWSFFEKQKLTGPNFIDWYRQLHLVLSTEDKENYLEHPIPAALVAQPRHQVPPEALAAHTAWVKGQKEVDVLMLLTMDLDIQWNLAHLGAYDMLQELKAMFSKQAEQELLQTVREFHTYKQEEGQSVSSHVLKMKSYIDNLERLGQPVGQNLAVSLILVSLNKDFASFVQNFNMHGMGKTVNELHAMLKLHEETLPKKDVNPALHAIRAGRTPPPPKKDNPAKDAIFHQCGEVGHWRRNCLVYLTELMKKKKLSQGASTSGSKKLKPGALSLYVGDGHRAAVESIKTYHLELPSGLVIVLNNCHYAPSITRVSKDESSLFYGCIYGMAFFEIDMFPCSIQNDRSIQEFLDHLKEHGIIAHRTPPYTPQNNGVSERRNRTLLDMVRSMMSQTTLPKSFWDYALETAARILNMVPSKKPSENKVFVARNAEFFESKLLDLKASGSVEDLEVIQEEDTNPSVDTSLNHEEDDQEIDEPQSDINPIRSLPPCNARTVGSKWLFKKKTDMDGQYTSLKSCVFPLFYVAKGSLITYGLIMKKPSSVADIRAIRILQ
ncbi:zinc finger, CCHC-type containing protein [Tanacetum coccineum]